MKRPGYFLSKSLWALAILLFSAGFLHAQKLDQATVQQLIQSKEFVFKAQSVLPMTGASRQLTYDYEVRVMGDTISSYLPYFGRAYSATYPGPGGVDFTSTDFDYQVKKAKKDRWRITIRPNDNQDVRELDLTVYENGSAYLQVISENRQPISYNGYILPRKIKQ